MKLLKEKHSDNRNEVKEKKQEEKKQEEKKQKEKKQKEKKQKEKKKSKSHEKKKDRREKKAKKDITKNETLTEEKKNGSRKRTVAERSNLDSKCDSRSTTSTPNSHPSLFISTPTASAVASLSSLISIPTRRRLSLAASKMAYVAAGKDRSESSSFTEERIVLINGHNEKLVGIFQKAISDDLVVLCHGFRSTKEGKPLSDVSDALLSQGISTFRFDFSGNGESDGTFMYGNYWKEVEDLRTAVIYFSEKRNIPVRGIVGHSKGGDVVILYASKYHDIPAVVNISGRFDLKTGVRERLGDDFMIKIKKDGFIDVATSGGGIGYRVTEQSLADRLATDVEAACSTIDPNCKVLTIHGSSDNVIPVSDASEFHRLIPNHQLQIVEGADHSYTQNKTELASAIVNFLKI